MVVCCAGVTVTAGRCVAPAPSVVRSQPVWWAVAARTAQQETSQRVRCMRGVRPRPNRVCRLLAAAAAAGSASRIVLPVRFVLPRFVTLANAQQQRSVMLAPATPQRRRNRRQTLS